MYGIDAAHGNSTFFYHFDRTGSTLLLTDGSGNTTDAYAYTPYGELLGHTGSNDQSFTFVGQYGVRHLKDTYYHMGRRFYDASSGHFLSRDAIGVNVYDVSSLNPYQYAQQDPINVIDPQGETGWNQDHTVWTGKSGQFVQTQAPHGNFLGGWKYVPFNKKQDNPPPADPQPPKKPDKVEPKPPDPPKEDPRETPKIAAKTSPDSGAAPPTETAPLPPDTSSSNTASVTDNAPPKGQPGNSQPPAGPDWGKFAIKQGQKVVQWGIVAATQKLVPNAFGKGLGTANRLAGVATDVLQVGAEGTRRSPRLWSSGKESKRIRGLIQPISILAEKTWLTQPGHSRTCSHGLFK